MQIVSVNSNSLRFISSGDLEHNKIVKDSQGSQIKTVNVHDFIRQSRLTISPRQVRTRDNGDAGRERGGGHGRQEGPRPGRDQGASIYVGRAQGSSIYVGRGQGASIYTLCTVHLQSQGV